MDDDLIGAPIPNGSDDDSGQDSGPRHVGIARIADHVGEVRIDFAATSIGTRIRIDVERGKLRIGNRVGVTIEQSFVSTDFVKT